MHKRISQQVHNLQYISTNKNVTFLTQNTAQKERHFQEMKPAKTLQACACNLPGKSHSEIKPDPFAGILMSMCKSNSLTVLFSGLTISLLGLLPIYVKESSPWDIFQGTPVLIMKLISDCSELASARKYKYNLDLFVALQLSSLTVYLIWPHTRVFTECKMCNCN